MISLCTKEQIRTFFLRENNLKDAKSIEDAFIAQIRILKSNRDIYDSLKGLYGIDVSAEMVSRITDKIIHIAKEWQNRPLEDLYTIAVSLHLLQVS